MKYSHRQVLRHVGQNSPITQATQYQNTAIPMQATTMVTASMRSCFIAKSGCLIHCTGTTKAVYPVKPSLTRRRASMAWLTEADFNYR